MLLLLRPWLCSACCLPYLCPTHGVKGVGRWRRRALSSSASEMPPKPAHGGHRTYVHRNGGGAAIRFASELEGAAASGFREGEAIEFNSMTHGGWMPAYVDTVYADGKLRLLAQPDRGGARARVLKDRVPPEEHLVRHRGATGSISPLPNAATHGFSVGQHVEYRSKSLGRWIRCIVARVHHDGALDLDREDDHLHTRANPAMVRQFMRTGGGFADPTDRGRPSALSATTMAKVKTVYSRLMATRKDRFPSRWLSQAEILLDQLEDELEAMGVPGGPRHPDLANITDNFIWWLQSNFIDGVPRSEQRRGLSLRCTTLATPQHSLAASGRRDGGVGDGGYGGLRLDPVGPAVARPGEDYETTPGEPGSDRITREQATDRGRPEPAGTAIEISHHPIGVVNGLYARGGGGPRKNGYHGGYPFYTKQLEDGKAVHLFFSDEFTSWFLSRSPSMNPNDLMYVGRLALERDWNRSASHVRYEADSSIALPAPPLGRHLWRCQTRWVLSDQQRPEPIEAWLTLTQRSSSQELDRELAGVRRDLAADLDRSGAGAQETAVERQRRKDRERAAATPGQGQRRAQPDTRPPDQLGQRAPSSFVATPRAQTAAVAAETVRQAAAGEIDDETALIEMLDIRELRTWLDRKGVKYLPSGSKEELKQLAHRHKDRKRPSRPAAVPGTYELPTAYGTMQVEPEPQQDPRPHRRAGGATAAGMAEGLPPTSRKKKIIEMQKEICYQLGLPDTLAPPQACANARAELGMASADASVTVVQNFAEIMARLNLSIYK